MTVDLTQPLVQFILGVCAVASGVLGTLLAFRGKNADQKSAARAQSFIELEGLAKERADEIAALRAENARLRTEYEGRWDRQLARCRSATDSLVGVIAEYGASSSTAVAAAVEALRGLYAHREDDHNEGGRGERP